MLEAKKRPLMKVRSRLMDQEPGASAQSGRPEDALLELYELLEKHAPSWYTEGHHDRAASALRLVKQP
jgi:hypothetical protein